MESRPQRKGAAPRQSAPRLSRHSCPARPTREHPAGNSPLFSQSAALLARAPAWSLKPPRAAHADRPSANAPPAFASLPSPKTRPCLERRYAMKPGGRKGLAGAAWRGWPRKGTSKFLGGAGMRDTARRGPGRRGEAYAKQPGRGAAGLGGEREATWRRRARRRPARSCEARSVPCNDPRDSLADGPGALGRRSCAAL